MYNQCLIKVPFGIETRDERGARLSVHISRSGVVQLTAPDQPQRRCQHFITLNLLISDSTIEEILQQQDI
ncbi:unnamed protein product [Parnassius mnemosyne]|uniref:PilZ domain-containing protein n=1 Tax=Parnassius mnemosyne TaxID=213953 RepID=A0AAV1LX85_9NEOP